MSDIGHDMTDGVLDGLEKRIAREYAQAYREVEKKADDYFARFAVKDKQKQALVKSGKLTEKEYKEWRKNQMLTGKRWTDLRDTLAKDLTNTNKIAAAMVRGELNNVFAINANYSEYLIENGMRTNYGFTLYDRDTVANLIKNDPDIIPWKPSVDIPADLRWNRQMITSHITQGILQGESIPRLSKRLLKTVNNNKVAAVRTARTAVTSSENAGRQMVYDKAQAMGIKLQKEWLATLDGRTRHEHGAVDGQRVDLDKPFNVGGYKMMYPADMSAPAHLVYNCFVGETKVASNSGVVRSYKHLYEGDLIEVKTACGVEFTCTPNHPILTPAGWVVANALNEGDDILVTLVGDGDSIIRNSDINHIHPTMEAFHNSFKSMRTACRDTSYSVNFHGDIPTTDVEIITQKGLLRKDGDARRGKSLNKFFLKFSDKSFLSKCSFLEHFKRIWRASFGFISGKSKPFAFFGRSVRHPNEHSGRFVANGNVVLFEYPINNLPAETVVRSELLDGLSRKVFVDKIVSVKVVSAKCQVYNLQTENGYYFVNSIIPQNSAKVNGFFAISKNCRCTTITVEPPHITKGEEPRRTYSEWIKTKEGQAAVELEKEQQKKKAKARKRRAAE